MTLCMVGMSIRLMCDSMGSSAGMQRAARSDAICYSTMAPLGVVGPPACGWRNQQSVTAILLRNMDTPPGALSSRKRSAIVSPSYKPSPKISLMTVIRSRLADDRQR